MNPYPEPKQWTLEHVYTSDSLYWTHDDGLRSRRGTPINHALGSAQDSGDVMRTAADIAAAIGLVTSILIYAIAK